MPGLSRPFLVALVPRVQDRRMPRPRERQPGRITVPWAMNAEEIVRTMRYPGSVYLGPIRAGETGR